MWNRKKYIRLDTKLCVLTSILQLTAKEVRILAVSPKAFFVKLSRVNILSFQKCPWILKTTFFSEEN